MKYIALDFEYRGTRNAKYDLVCVAVATANGKKAIWLHNDEQAKKDFKDWLLSKRETHVLLAWNVDAEGRSLVSLGLNPIKFKWIDLQAEWKMLTNHNDKLGYGQHFINGKFKKTKRKKYGSKADGIAHDKTPVNLLGATYKLLGKGSEEEYEHKNDMRNLIIHTSRFNQEQKEQILEYCLGDVDDLKAIYDAEMKHYKKLLSMKERKTLHDDMLWRGETVARAAVIASIGYPVNREKVTNFTKNIPNMIKDCQEDINSQFPEMEIFVWNKKEERYSFRQKDVKAWIQNSIYADRWLRTASGDFSLSLDAFSKHFSYRHNFPREDLPAQMLRYLKLMQSLNGFRPKSVTAKNKDTFFSYYGDDDRAHPYLNAYGSQSARYQPKATGFLHLKAAWVRSLVEPKPGRVIVAIDFGSEEFLLAALISGDENMIAAYKSGDVYLYFAKLAGAVPWDGKKSDYKKERDRFKSTTLGISYLMGPVALAAKLTNDTGEKHTEKDAQDLINKFNKAYPKYAKWIEDTQTKYERSDNARIALPDNWYLFNDNDNKRSISNYPVQGFGSSILRKAIQLCQDAGLVIILPLHDCLYLECDYSNVTNVITVFKDCMREAFCFYFDGEKKDQARELIRLDVNAWGPDCKDEYIDGVKYQKIYIDERSEAEYAKFSKYFNKL